ncbi:MAG: bifunctional diguanylate cyclase/phosphodiesterase [Thalassotalea sp.]
MDLSANTEKATRQLPKLKSLLNKYRQVRTMQSGLLRLSELAGTITDIDSFYQALDGVISSLLITDNFHIVLADDDKNLSLAYTRNTDKNHLLEFLQASQWQQSLTALVYKERRSVHCSSAEHMALMKAEKISQHTFQCVDWLGVPLKRGNQVIGVIALQSYDDKHYFDDRDCQLLEFIAEHIVTAIDRVKSRELLENSIQERTLKLTKTNRELQNEIAERQKAQRIHEVLLAVSEITASSKDLPTFYQALHHEIRRLLPANNFYIALVSADRKFLECPYFVDQRVTDMVRRPFGKGLSEKTILAGSPILISGDEQFLLNESGRVVKAKLTDFQAINIMPKAWLSSPLIEQGKVFGMFAVQDYQDANAYQESDLELIRFVAQHIAIAIVRKRTQLMELQSKDALEHTVKDRTKALEIANLKLRMQIEERKKAEEKLFYEAHHDALTQLPNRAMFSDRLTYSLSHYKRHPNQRFAVLFIDLDRFKMINDTLGHLAGDKFLVEISQRLSECIRDNDLLARLGGDEFVILLDNFQTQDDVEEIAGRIITRVSESFNIDGHDLYSNASIGIAMFNQQYKEASEILRDADAAMYQAKSLGRGRYVFFDESMRQQLLASMTLEQELRNAIKAEQFELHYQQISSLNNAGTIGFEAFLRWRHPEKGLLTPSHFLYMAEETGVILDIENWVIEQVSIQLKLWKNHDKYQKAFIGINLSGRHLTQANQLNKLMAVITKHTIDPQHLILEFNEKAFEKHADVALKGLRTLKEFGVKLALDDYGSGLSSFNFLHSYPFEYIKLDRSFIREISSNEENLLLVKALHTLGEQFGYRLVAEGIESEEMLNKLKAVGCEYGQGYHINRPEKIDNEIINPESDFQQAELA